MTVHYVCTGGCNDVSDEPRTCQTKDCMKYHQPMTACHCEDGLHEEAFSHPNDLSSDMKTHAE